MSHYIPYIALAVVVILVFGLRFVIDTTKRVILIALIVCGALYISQTYDVDPNRVWSYITTQANSLYTKAQDAFK